MTRLNAQAQEILKNYKLAHESRIKTIYNITKRQISYSDVIIYLNDLLTDNIIDIICNQCNNYFALFKDQLPAQDQKLPDPDDEPVACPYCGDQTLAFTNSLGAAGL